METRPLVTPSRRSSPAGRKSILVYCGAKTGDDPKFLDVAREVGASAAARGWRLVYGGGKLGLMGATAGAARDAGGAVFGIIPDFLVDLEGVLEGVEHTIVKTMHERKMRMFEEADAILALPGGIGTLEEVVETVSWARLQLHRKPIVVLDIDGFWTPLRALFDHIVARGFADPELLDDLCFVSDVDGAFRAAERRMLSEVI